MNTKTQLSAEQTTRDLLAAQQAFIKARDKHRAAGLGGARTFPDKKLVGGYYISFSGRVWKGSTMVLDLPKP